MSEAKHTPGPWSWSDKFLTSDSAQHTWSLLGANGYGILSCDGDSNSPQYLGESGKADALLIAAAPELLEALKLVRDYIVTMKGNGHEYQAAVDAAIAKAEGKP